MSKHRKLTGRQKAAVLLISLGPELSAKVMKQLSEEDIEKITYEIANMDVVDAETQQEVLKEFLELHEVQYYLLKGGVEYAKQVLEKSLGPAKANEYIRKLTAATKKYPFSSLRKTDPKHLVNFIGNEHPQTIALILSYLDPEQAAMVLSELPQDVQAEIAKRIAKMETTSPEIVKEVEAVLEKKLSTFVGERFTFAGGIQTVVDILNRADRSTERTIIETLEQDDPELAEEIRNRLFVFEDINILDDTAIRRVLREVDMKDLAKALKGASDELMNRILRNMSKRAGEMLQEEMEFLGPVRLREVEEAQQNIVQIIRRLDEAGEIIISRGGEDEVIV
ncbi:MAG TPA: flagellar motor switch protein FliG [Peptococcaceae bacterium]|nr:MAG: Flagellar motor switch protein FliG [Clostridia bacterium 41_269]HBT20173.1 flagellar motor switch protein FliG [Peptococcaceae bacterium]